MQSPQLSKHRSYRKKRVFKRLKRKLTVLFKRNICRHFKASSEIDSTFCPCSWIFFIRPMSIVVARKFFDEKRFNIKEKSWKRCDLMRVILLRLPVIPNPLIWTIYYRYRSHYNILKLRIVLRSFYLLSSYIKHKKKKLPSLIWTW